MAINELEQQELQEALQEQQRQGFRVHDLPSAEWVLRKLKALAAKEQEIRTLADDERERITAWEQRELRTIESSRHYFNSLLQEYMVAQREVDPKFRISTPSGKVTMRKQQPKWNYDEAQVLAWLKENKPELVRVKEEINKAELKKSVEVFGDVVIDENGEVIPGIHIEEQPEVLKVEVS